LNRLTVSKSIALTVGAICIVFAYNYNKSATYKISGPIYGTYWQLVSTEYISDPLKKSIEDELARIDLIASNYKKSSELSKINSAPLGEEIDISADMYSLLSYAEQLYQITDGLYDVTVGSLVIENGFGPANTSTSNQNTIPVSKERFNLISNNRIIKNDNFQFDLSSIAKGYAVDAIAKLLINSNRNNFLIDIGGEIIVNGSKHGVPWVIGIQDPSSLQNQSIIEISRTGFLAVATSGEYRNTNINDAGEIISHTFNPIKKQSLLDKSYSVTVASEESSMSADAWATALNVLGPDRGIKLANSNSVSAMYLIDKDNIIMKSKYWNYSD
jgi:thiamine biosynthesis lipoprotein